MGVGGGPYPAQFLDLCKGISTVALNKLRQWDTRDRALRAVSKRKEGGLGCLANALKMPHAKPYGTQGSRVANYSFPKLLCALARR